jgi:predicted Ser/Thr protein kinase
MTDRETSAPESLGPYRLLNRLGEGGMGVVHLGLDRAGRAVAIKVLREHVAHDPDARARLAREVSTLQRVRHPLVAEVIDADVDGDQPYVVTRFVNGPSLDEVVRHDGPLSADALTRLGRGLSSALEAIHAAGIVHRDLKPGNVLLLDGKPVVIDFGIAHVADDVRLTTVGLVMGTPGYLSPEVVDGQAVTTATDWWGWAATLAFAASGRPPFGRGPMDVVIDRVRRGDTDLDGVDPRLRPLLAAALSVSPELRPGADEVLGALDSYAAGGDTTLLVSRGDAGTLPMRTAAAMSSGATRATRALTGAAATRQAPVASAAPVVAEPVPRSLHGELFAPDEQPAPAPRRTGTAFTLFTALVALVVCAAAWPVLAAAVTLALMVLARSVDRGTSALARRRYDHGARRSDSLVAVVTSPWHLLAGALATVLTVLLPGALGIATVFFTGLLLSPDGRPAPGSLPAVAAGALVALLAAWWGVGGQPLRRGSRTLARGLTPGRSARVLVPLLLVASAAAGVAAVQQGAPDWTPLHTLPAGITLPG